MLYINVFLFIISICLCYYGLEHKYKNTNIDFLIRNYICFIFVKNFVPTILLVLTGILITEQCLCDSVIESFFSGIVVSLLTYFLFQGYDYHLKRRKWRDVISVIVWNITNCSLLYLYNLTFQGYSTVANSQLSKEMQTYSSTFAAVRNKILKFQLSGRHYNDIQQIVNFENEMLSVLRDIQMIEMYQPINIYCFKDFIDTVGSLIDRLELVFHQIMLYIPEDDNKFIEPLSQWIEALQYLRGDKNKILLQPTNVIKIVHDIDIVSKNKIVLEKLIEFVGK